MEDRKVHRSILKTILLLAFLLRLPSIFWGIPIFDQHVHNYHPDEPKIINGAYNFPAHIRTNNDLRYPTFYHYFLGSLSIPAKIVFKVNHWSSVDYYNYISVFARFVTILLGLGSVYLTFLLGKKFYNIKIGLLSALFITLSLYHIQSSSWATLDVPNSFFFILTIYFAVNMHDKPSWKSYLLTSVSLGILLGTKYTGITALIFIIIIHFHQSFINGNTLSSALFSKKLLTFFVAAALVFLITTPGIILKPAVFINSIDQLINKDAGRKYRVLDFTIIFEIIRNFARTADPVIAGFTLLGFVYPLKRRWDKELPLILTIIIFSLAFGVLTARHLIAVLPLASVIAAGAVYHLYRKFKAIPKALWIFFFVIWIIFAFVYNSVGILIRINDTRTAASHYIEETIPSGSTIGAISIGNYQRWSWMLPKLDNSKFKMADALDKPDYIILTTFDYDKMAEALRSEKLHDYTWDPRFSMEWYKAIPPGKEVFKFYDDILNNKGVEYKYSLIKIFSKDIIVPIEFPPPQIRIYKRR